MIARESETMTPALSNEGSLRSNDSGLRKDSLPKPVLSIASPSSHSVAWNQPDLAVALSRESSSLSAAPPRSQREPSIGSDAPTTESSVSLILPPAPPTAQLSGGSATETIICVASATLRYDDVKNSQVTANTDDPLRQGATPPSQRFNTAAALFDAVSSSGPRRSGLFWSGSASPAASTCFDDPALFTSRSFASPSRRSAADSTEEILATSSSSSSASSPALVGEGEPRTVPPTALRRTTFNPSGVCCYADADGPCGSTAQPLTFDDAFELFVAELTVNCKNNNPPAPQHGAAAASSAADEADIEVALITSPSQEEDARRAGVFFSQFVDADAATNPLDLDRQNWK